MDEDKTKEVQSTDTPITPQGSSPQVPEAQSATQVSEPTQSSPTPPSDPTTQTPVTGGEVAYAGIFSRFLAVLIDSLIVWVVQAGVFFLLGLALGNVLGKDNPLLVLLMGIVVLGIIVGYYVFYQAKTGQTLGKKVLSLKVVNETGQTPGAGKFFLREIIGKLLSSILMIGYLIAIFDKRKQALHDKIAGTFVIKV